MDQYGIKGFAKVGDEVPVKVFWVIAEGPDEALSEMRRSGHADGLDVREAVKLRGASGKPAGVIYAGPWPWKTA